MTTSEAIYTGLLMLAVLLVFFAVFEYNKSKKLLASGTKTKATVIRLIPKDDEGGILYTAEFEYIDKSKNKVVFEDSFSSNPAAYKIGQKVQIVYSKQLRQQKVVSYWGLYWISVVLLSISAPMLIIGGGYWLFAKGII